MLTQTLALTDLRVGQLPEQAIAIGNVACLPALQSSEKQLCHGRFAAAPLQPSDHFALTGDIDFLALHKAFDLP